MLATSVSVSRLLNLVGTKLFTSRIYLISQFYETTHNRGIAYVYGKQA